MLFKHCNVVIVPKQDNNGTINGATFKFSESSQDEVYTTTNGTPVSLPPELFSEGVNLSFNALIDLSSALLNSVSTYLFQFRQELNNGENIFYIKPETDDDTRGLKIYTSKYFFRDKDRSHHGRYKVKISIINYSDKNNPYEEVVFPFTKRDVIQLLNLIRLTINQASKTKPLFLPADIYDIKTGKCLGSTSLMMSRRQNSFNIGTVFLHGQELLNLIYAVDKLSFSMGIENHLNNLFANFRQTLFTVNPKDSLKYFETKREEQKEEKDLSSLPDLIRAETDESIAKNGYSNFEVNDSVLYLVLTKYNYENIPQPVKFEGKDVVYAIPFSTKFLTLVYLCITINSLRLRFDEDDETEEIGVKVFGSEAENAHIKYFLSFRESSLGIGVKKYKFNRNKQEDVFPRITFFGKVNPGVYKTTLNGMERDNVVFKRDERGDKIAIDVLTNFGVTLESEQWLKLVKGLSVIYTRAYEKAGNTHNLVKFYARNQTKNGEQEKYYFTLTASVYNEASCILEIEKFVYDRKSKKEVFVAAYRQPLYEKYIYQLLTVLLSCSEFIDNNLYTKAVKSTELMYFKYKSMKNVDFNSISEMDYGIKRVDSKNENEPSEVYWGDFKGKTTSLKQSKLNSADQFLLNQSAMFKLLRGYWQPFVGDNIAIGPDGYITDNYGEIDTTKPTFEGELYPDFDWALNIYFGTSYPNYRLLSQENDY